MKNIKLYKEFISLNESDDPFNDDHIYKIWKILEFKDTETGEIVNNIEEDLIPTTHIPEDWRYHIHKVKRTTDGEIFTIGDYLTHVYKENENGFGNIDFMYRSGNQIRMDIGRMGLPIRDGLYVLDEEVMKRKKYNV